MVSKRQMTRASATTTALPPGTGWWARHAHFRWVYMFLLFGYLFALAMTLFEIDAFQTLVAQLAGSNVDAGRAAGNSRQREVLQAVRRTQLERPDGEGSVQEQQAVLFERVAARLDPLRVAVGVLTDIGARARFNVRYDDAFKRAQQEAFHELAERIVLAVTGLQREIGRLPVCNPPTGEPSAPRDTPDGKQPTALACKQIQGITGDLVALDAGIAALIGRLPKAMGNAAVMDQLDLTDKAQAAQLKTDAKDLAIKVEEEVRALKQGIENWEPGQFPADIALLESMHKTLDALRDIDKEEAFRWILGSFPTKESGVVSPGSTKFQALKPISKDLQPGKPDDEVVELRRILEAYGIFNGKPADFPVDKSVTTDAQRRLLDEKLRQLVTQFQKDEGLAPGLVGRQTQAKLASFVQTCNADPEKCRGTTGGQSPLSVDIGPDLQRLRMALYNVKDLVAEEGINLKALGALTGNLAKIEVAARRLGELEVQVESLPGTDAQGTTALDSSRRQYQQGIADLTAALTGMRRTLENATGVVQIADAIGEQDPLADRKAVSILREYQALDRYQLILTPLAFLALPEPNCPATDWQSPLCLMGQVVVSIWNRVTGIGFRAMDMATMTRQALDMMVVFVMGAMGSLIYLIRYLLGQLMLNQREGSPVWRPMTWYVFRPLFGIVVAFAIYLLYKTGQVALGGSNGNILAADVNLPILSLFALFAGLLSWQALEMVESKGSRWLSAQRRENLWASGLCQALRTAGKTISDCAAQIGVTSTQIDRWIGGQDKVTPEMQDRILTWLNREPAELFSDVNPQNIDEGTLRWATGLKQVLLNNKNGTDVPRLAQLVEQDVTTVQAWVDLKRQVDQEMQFLIAQKLNVPRDTLFTIERPDQEYWAVGLRTALHKGATRFGSAAALASAIGSTQQNIRRYMELKASVPQTLQNLIAEAMELDRATLFSATPPPDAEFKWAANLRDFLRKSTFKDAAALADAIDTEATWVRAWMEQEVCGETDAPFCGQVAPATQLALTEALNCTPDALFRSERAAADFRWVVMPRFGDLVEGRGGVGALASRLDLEAVRVERWMAGSEPVAPETQLTLLADLGLPVEERTDLFASRPPPVPGAIDGVWWATGLRTAVRGHPGYGTLGRLATELQVPVQTLLDQVELLAPVPMDLRDRILRLLGPTATQGGALFTTQTPDWTQFQWAPGLRSALRQAELDAAEFAAVIDTDPTRMQDWMEMDQNDPASPWVQGKIKKGQIAPATRAAIVAALDGRYPEATLFSATRPTTGALWAVKPNFRMAVEFFDGKVAGFARQIDTDPARVERWADQLEQVEAGIQDDILKMLGLKPEDRAQLFAATQRSEEAVG